MKSIQLLIALLFMSYVLDAQSERDILYADIAYLSADTLKGRTTGSKEEAIAAAYLAQRFQSLGCKPAGELGTFYQFFSGKILANPHASQDDAGEVLNGQNVVALIDHGAEKTVVFGAHYDHLGMGHEGSLHVGEPEVHNGADDNASGTAGLLALAERLQDFKAFNYLFIAFSGEERGLWGSNFWTKNPTIPLEDISFMMNMDMIGRLDNSRGLAINGTGTATQWAQLIKEIDNKFKVPLKLFESGFGPSDFVSFYQQDIPVLSFFTGQHEDYHKPSDDVDKINFEGIKTVLDMMEHIVRRSADFSEITFQKTKDETPSAPRFTVTLGVMPDYLYSDGGMRIDGVRDDRPAQKAGIEKGDVVIKMGDIEVTDVMTYMEALSKYKAGDKAPVKIKRGDQEIDVEVQF